MTCAAIFWLVSLPILLFPLHLEHKDGNLADEGDPHFATRMVWSVLLWPVALPVGLVSLTAKGALTLLRCTTSMLRDDLAKRRKPTDKPETF